MLASAFDQNQQYANSFFFLWLKLVIASLVIYFTTAC